jgi:hypothetical protein
MLCNTVKRAPSRTTIHGSFSCNAYNVIVIVTLSCTHVVFVAAKKNHVIVVVILSCAHVLLQAERQKEGQEPE